jgi:hypothetical protein
VKTRPSPAWNLKHLCVPPLVAPWSFTRQPCKGVKLGAMILRDWNLLIRWLIAGLVSAIISTAACLFFGYLLPTWIVGPDQRDSALTGEVFSITLTFATVYSLFGFILLTLFFHRKLMPNAESKQPALPITPSASLPGQSVAG